MQFVDRVSISWCVTEPQTRCPMQDARGIINHPLTFLEYRHLQNQFIGHTCHVERTKKALSVATPTLRQLEEHFIRHEMDLFEFYFLPYLSGQKIDYAAYLMGEIEDIRSDANRHFAWTALGRPPTEEDLAMHYITSEAHENYRARFWHLVAA